MYFKCSLQKLVFWVFSGLHLINAKLPHHCINCFSYTLSYALPRRLGQTEQSSIHLSVGCTSSTLLWWELRTCGSKRKEWETCWRMSSCLGIMLIASWCRTYKDYRRYLFVTVVSDEIGDFCRSDPGKPVLKGYRLLKVLKGYCLFIWCRKKIFSSCTMRTQQSRATTSWTNGSSLSPSRWSSSSKQRWTVRLTDPQVFIA